MVNGSPPIKPDRTTWFVTIVSAAVLTVSKYHCSTGEYGDLFGKLSANGGALADAAARFGFPNAAHWLTDATGHDTDHLYWFLSSLVLFVAVPVVASLATPGISLREFGIGAGDWRYGLKVWALLYGIMLPVVLIAVHTPSFAGQYPMSSGAATNWRSLIIFEAAYASYFIGWEFVYRGMLCNGMYPRIGFAAVLLQAIPFGIMHAGKPEPEAYGSIIAAVALGYLAVRTRSFWYGCGLHASVAFTMDVAALTHTHKWPKVW